jgi:hypothetical protein
MMNKFSSALWLSFVASLHASAAFGHGLPIFANGERGALTISGGLPLSAGYVGQGFDYHEDAFLDFGPNNTQFTSLPGFHLSGINSGSQIYLEVLSRPDFMQEGAPLRWLWFWDKETQSLAEAPDDPQVRIASQKGYGDVRITQFAPPATASSVKILEPNAGEIGSHQHPLLYFLDDSPAAKFGAYGFFVRLTSPSYGATEPLLITLNHSLSSEEFDAASRQINAAASLPGDFDRNDVVDGADFLAWQRSFGSTTALAADGSLNGVVDDADLAVWQQNFGRRWPSTGALIATPEPATGVLVAIAVMLSGGVRRSGSYGSSGSNCGSKSTCGKRLRRRLR